MAIPCFCLPESCPQSCSEDSFTKCPLNAPELRALLEPLWGTRDKAAFNAVKPLVMAAREAVLAANPELREEADAHAEEVRAYAATIRAEPSRAGGDIALEMQERMAEARREAERVRADAEKVRADADRMRTSFTDSPMPTRPRFEPVEKVKLVCPICLEPGRGNMVNGELVCTHDQQEFGPWHRLVPFEELEKYNRAYRRKWIKRARKPRR